MIKDRTRRELEDILDSGLLAIMEISKGLSPAKAQNILKGPLPSNGIHPEILKKKFDRWTRLRLARLTDRYDRLGGKWSRVYQITEKGKEDVRIQELQMQAFNIGMKTLGYAA